MHSDPREASGETGIERQWGFLPRFVCTTDQTEHERLIFAAKAAASVRLDYPSLNTFLRAGLYLNGSTPFQEVRRVSPPVVIVKPVDISREAAIEAYIDLFSQAVRRRTTGRSVIALSGGADSRHILLELHAQERLPEYALTVAIPGRPSEVQIAAELAKRVSIPHKVVTPSPMRAYSDEVWKNQICDFMSLEHGWFSQAGQERDNLDWWDGIGGDVLSAGLFLDEGTLTPFRRGSLDELAERLVQPGPVPHFRDQLYFDRREAVNAVRVELAKHEAAPNPVGSFYFWNRTRVQIGASAFGLLRPSGQTVLAPYLDRDLWNFLAALPAEMLLDHTFHTETIARAYPGFADVPYFRDKLRPPSSLLRAKTISLAMGLISHPGFDLDWMRALARTMRALADSRYRDSIQWLLPGAVYCLQLKLLRRRR